MRKTLTSALAVAGAALTGCSAVPDDPAQPAPSAGIESAVISGIYDHPIRLEQGHYQGAAFAPGGASRPTVQLLPRPRLQADLDGDGRPEWLAVVAETSGGSGTFLYLTVLQQGADGVRSRATVFLGDRVQVEQLSANGATVRVDLLEAGADAPACCPTTWRTRRWKWLDDDLLPLSRFAGVLLYGHEAREFVTCDGHRYWVADQTGGDLRRLYDARTTEPYRKLFAELEAVRLAAPDAAFAATFDEQLHVTRLKRLESEGPGCALDLAGAQFRATGVEPFWRVDVQRDALRLFRIGQAPRLFTTSARENGASGPTWQAAGNGDALTLTLEERRCVNPMSGSVFAYTAVLRVAGETLHGCALEPLPAPSD